MSHVGTKAFRGGFRLPVVYCLVNQFDPRFVDTLLDNSNIDINLTCRWPIGGTTALLAAVNVSLPSLPFSYRL